MSNKTTYQIQLLLASNLDGSLYVQKSRRAKLLKFIKHLQENHSYSKRWNLANIGAKDIHRFVHDLKKEGIQHRTIENILADIRWMASKFYPEPLIPSNFQCGLKKRDYTRFNNRAVKLTKSQLAMMDERMQLINRLKFEFGLWEKEALSFGYEYATIKPGVIQLKDKWCKNNNPREIPIVNNSQLHLLKEIRVFQKKEGDDSMIPNNKKFSSYRGEVQERSRELGLKGHGLRYQWAHERFNQLSGMKCPMQGGPHFQELNNEEKHKYLKSMYLLALELGIKNRLDQIIVNIGNIQGLSNKEYVKYHE